MSAVVLTERRGPSFRITLNRPERRNALNAEVLSLIVRGLDEAEADPDIRVVVISGTGDKAFCAGGDLSAHADGAPFSVDPSRPHNMIVDAFKRIERCELPIVARVNGHALAGGFGLMCACDLAISADHASFGVPEAKIGIFPMTIMPYLLRVLPPRKFMELCMTGESISAQEALQIGLLNAVVPASELDTSVDALINTLCARSPTGIRLGKQAFHAMRDMSLQQGLDYAELMLPMMSATQDAREGMKAFQEKRAPVWKNR
jgi:enoyl-CoA hydratase/carnithine racemase